MKMGFLLKNNARRGMVRERSAQKGERKRSAQKGREKGVLKKGRGKGGRKKASKIREF